MPDLRRSRLVVVSAALVVLAVAFAPATADADTRRWRVRSGDALGLVAQRFGVTVEELREWNEIDGDTIYIGQELIVGEQEERASLRGYVVSSGDTLSDIAVRFGVTVDDLCGWNPGLNPDRIQRGQELRLGPERRRVEYRVRAGDSLSRVARRFDVRVPDLLRWNRGLSRDHVRIGRTLVVYSDRPQSLSEAIGSAGQGRLSRGVRLRRHRGYVIRDRNRAWGTEETVSWLVEAFDSVRREHGDDRRIRVHDISLRRGGYMNGHVSHQNGRDVDMSLYQRRCAGRPCPMRRLEPGDVDVSRQWALLSHMLSRGRVDAIFLDYDLQEPLYRQARASGATRAQLHRWFQYPRGRTHPLGIIRHYPRHRDHIHVRFACHDSDEECR